MNDILTFLGLIKKAGRLAIGDERTALAVSNAQAKVLILASDASRNITKRAYALSDAGGIPIRTLPWDKGALGSALGVKLCALCAICDAGFAKKFAEKFAEIEKNG